MNSKNSPIIPETPPAGNDTTGTQHTPLERIGHQAIPQTPIPHTPPGRIRNERTSPPRNLHHRIRSTPAQDTAHVTSSGRHFFIPSTPTPVNQIPDYETLEESFMSLHGDISSPTDSPTDYEEWRRRPENDFLDVIYTPVKRRVTPTTHNERSPKRPRIGERVAVPSVKVQSLLSSPISEGPSLPALNPREEASTESTPQNRPKSPPGRSHSNQNENEGKLDSKTEEDWSPFYYVSSSEPSTVGPNSDKENKPPRALASPPGHRNDSTEHETSHWEEETQVGDDEDQDHQDKLESGEGLTRKENNSIVAQRSIPLPELRTLSIQGRRTKREEWDSLPRVVKAARLARQGQPHSPPPPNTTPSVESPPPPSTLSPEPTPRADREPFRGMPGVQNYPTERSNQYLPGGCSGNRTSDYPQIRSIETLRQRLGLEDDTVYHGVRATIHSVYRSKRKTPGETKRRNRPLWDETLWEIAATDVFPPAIRNGILELPRTEWDQLKRFLWHALDNLVALNTKPVEQSWKNSMEALKRYLENHPEWGDAN